MTANLHIDNKDVYTEYGVFILEDSYKSLLQYASLKSLPQNSWHEEDGIQVDLSNPALDTKELSIVFGIHNPMKIGEFFAWISDGAFHDFRFDDLKRSYKLRLSNHNDLTLYPNMGKFTLQFSHDYPLAGYTYQEPATSFSKVTGYEIGYKTERKDLLFRDLGDYGISIAEGTFPEIVKSPTVKKNLQITLQNANGAVYDGQQVTFESKDVKLNCVMRANSFDEFWRNYDAFIYDLIRPGERKLYVDDTGYEYPYYYKSCNSTRFVDADKIWYEFTLTLTFTSFRLYEDEYILASESNISIITEDDKDDKYHYIDLGHEN